MDGNEDIDLTRTTQSWRCAVTRRMDPMPDDANLDLDRLPALIDEAILAQRYDIRKHIIENATPLDFSVWPVDDSGHLVVCVGGLPLREIHWSELVVGASS